MCHRSEHDHLMASTEAQVAETIRLQDEEDHLRHEEEVTAFVTVTRTPIVDPETGVAYLTKTTVISPVVRRNIDGAQYAQPRGSQYEGPDPDLHHGWDR
jgi:hypothetical protein